ncbi:hypothetical protein HY041_00860 [Candidatus Roizmanbacteria bacterium]|nr:hypothetical protein [Candidatus Roizmanbacteria bacterium]
MKTIKRLHLYFTRNSKNSNIQKSSAKQIQSLMEIVYIQSAKKYLATKKNIVNFKQFTKKKLIGIGMKHLDKKILNKHVEGNFTQFRGEGGFKDPTNILKLITTKNSSTIITNHGWFSEEIRVNNFTEVLDLIHWPEIQSSQAKDCTESILNILTSEDVSKQGTLSSSDRISLRKDVEYFVSNDLPIRISFYLFCGKIGNPFKVYSIQPRLADYYGLKKLVAIENAIRTIYKPKNHPFSVEWFIIDQTKMQRFDIPPGQEKSTRNIYSKFLHKLQATKFIHIIPWEDLIADQKEYKKIVYALRKQYVKAYTMLEKETEIDLKTSIRAEKMRDRIKSGFTIINPCLFPNGNLGLEDVLIIYNDVFPGLHFHVRKLTPFQKYLYSWIINRSINESADYFATLEARTIAKNFGSNLPKSISVTITKKPGRLVLHYLGSGGGTGSRFFPDVGESIILPNGKLTIMPYITILCYPGRFTPVFVEEFDKDKPFFWLCKQNFGE